MAPKPPSPHRFLGSRRAPSPEKNTKYAPTSKANATQQSRPLPTPRTPVPTSSQFAVAPRFSASRPKGLPRSPPRPTLISALRTTTTQADDVEDTAESTDDDEMLLDVDCDIAFPTVEHNKYLEHGHVYDLPHSPKRRRLESFEIKDDVATGSDAPPKSTPHFRLLSEPSSLRASAPVGPPHFSSSSYRQATTDDEAGQNSAPHFQSFLRPPASAAVEQTEPLPDVFSPHRRGQKFVPGGMASTVQQWIIGAGQSAMQSRRGQVYLRGDDYVVKVKLDDVNGEGPYLAKGVSIEGVATSLLLSHNASSHVNRHSRGPEPGAVVGIRAPTWEVELLGEHWQVGVDWRIVQ